MKSLYWEAFQDGMLTACRRIQHGESIAEVIASAEQLETECLSGIDREFVRAVNAFEAKESANDWLPE